MRDVGGAQHLAKLRHYRRVRTVQSVFLFELPRQIRLDRAGSARRREPRDAGGEINVYEDIEIDAAGRGVIMLA